MFLIGIVVVFASITHVASYSVNLGMTAVDSDDQDDGFYAESGSGSTASVEVTSLLEVSSAPGTSVGVASKVYVTTSKVPEETFDPAIASAFELDRQKKDPNSSVLIIIAVVVCIAIVVVGVVVAVMTTAIVKRKRKQRLFSLTRSKDVSPTESNVYQRHYARIPPNTNGTSNADQSSPPASHGHCNPIYDEI